MDDSTRNFSNNLRRAWEISNQVTAAHGATYVGSEHFVYAFLTMPNCSAYPILAGAGITKAAYEELFIRALTEPCAVQGFTPNTLRIIRRANEIAELTETQTGTVHFLLAVAEKETCKAMEIFHALGADADFMRERCDEVLTELQNKRRLGLDDGDDDKNSSPEPQTPFGGFDQSLGGNAKQTAQKQTTQMKKYEFEEKKSARSGHEKLLLYGTDLTERARRGKIDPVIGRKKEIEKVIQVLCRRSKNNPVLIGEPGVGKSAIAEGLSQLIVEENVPEQLVNKTVFSVDIAGMLAGARYRGDFEERLKDLIEEVVEDGDIVLFIDEIHTIVGAGSSADNTMDAANILKPMLARGDLQVIGATTIEEYRKYIEKDSALERRFTPVSVDEPSEADAIAILKGLRPKYEKHHGIAITDAAIEAAVKLSVRYINDRYLPDKAIDLVDEAASRARIISEDGGEEIAELKERADELGEEIQLCRSQGKYNEAAEALKEKQRTETQIESLKRAQSLERGADGRLSLGKEQVAAIVGARMKIPLTSITQEEGEKLMRLEEDLHKRIIGQNEAVSAVARSIRRARAGLKDPSRPIGSFIFVGPTGVGKTDLCKALAESMFGNEEQMIRLDMSEYMEKQSVSKLIGAPPGYVGYDDAGTGKLTDKVRSKPYSVILFDEIEKAHPDVFNLLLQLLDDGRLTDNKGRTVSFKNAVIIMTSNVGAAEAERAVSYGFGGEINSAAGTDEKAYEELKENVTKALKDRFRPEFLNRLDDVIVFHKLSEADAEKIAAKLISSLSKRLMEQRGILLNVTNAALSALVKEGYDSRYGARPLKRTIQKRIEDRLSEEILVGRVTNGRAVTVDYLGGEFRFRT